MVVVTRYEVVIKRDTEAIAIDVVIATRDEVVVTRYIVVATSDVVKYLQEML